MELKDRFVSIGECMVEMSPSGEENYALGFAGDCLNTAYYARHLLDENWQVDFVSALGDDIYSTKMRQFIEGHKIGCTHVLERKNQCTGMYFIHQADGDRHFTYWRDSSAATGLADDVMRLHSALKGAKLVYFSGITLAIIGATGRKNLIQALQTARQDGATIAFDPNIRLRLWKTPQEGISAIETICAHVDIILPTFDDESSLFGDKTPLATAKRYQKWGVRETVVKDGANAVHIVAKNLSQKVATSTQKALDATGAGDAFNGAYLCARLTGKSPQSSVKFAHDLAGQTVLHRGALVDRRYLPLLAC